MSASKWHRHQNSAKIYFSLTFLPTQALSTLHLSYRPMRTVPLLVMEFSARLRGMLASMVAQMVKNLLAMQDTQVWSLGQEEPLQKEMATHSSMLAWRIPWTEEPSGLQSVESDSAQCLTLSLFFKGIGLRLPCISHMWFTTDLRDHLHWLEGPLLGKIFFFSCHILVSVLPYSSFFFFWLRCSWFTMLC